MCRIFFTAACLLVFSTAAMAAAAGEERHDEVLRLLEQIEEKTSGIRTLKTEFVQEKNLAAFTHGIVLRGRVFMRKPGRLAWHVDEPLRYSVLITEKAVSQWDEDTDRVDEIPLADNPVLNTALRQMTVWFSGRYSVLLEDYEVNVSRESPLVLEFLPREDTVIGKAIRSISIGLGEDRRYLKWIKILEAGGDSTTITFHNTVLNAPLKDGDFEVKGRV
jgi:outer membrane lipoprotein-sorting protein